MEVLLSLLNPSIISSLGIPVLILIACGYVLIKQIKRGDSIQELRVQDAKDYATKVTDLTQAVQVTLSKLLDKLETKNDK